LIRRHPTSPPFPYTTLFRSPAFPLSHVVDPTGAGDSFVGGFIGYLASRNGPVETNLKRGMIYGSVVASFCCQGFGLMRTTKVTRDRKSTRLNSSHVSISYAV